FLPAAVDADWRGVGRSACVTGCAQMALVWFRLARAINDASVASAARRLLEQVKSWQFLRGRDPETIGALPGSMPIWGSYEPFRWPNWGVKFFCDALLAAADRPSEQT